MNLSAKADIITFPVTHYVYIEKEGAFHLTAMAAWAELHALIPKLADNAKIKGYMSLYKVAPLTYCAGVSVEAMPQKLPTGLKYMKFPGGKYSRFKFTGPYTGLPAASGKVFETIVKDQIQVRDDYFIESYVSDPKVLPASKAMTEILVPTM